MDARLDNHSFIQQMAFESFVQMRQDVRSRRSDVTNMVNLTELGGEYLALTTKPERLSQKQLKIDEPTSWGQAIRGKDRWLWEAAVRQEIMQLFEIGAFEWTDSRDGKLEGNRSIPSHVVLKLKHEGITAVRSKGRLVADGNFQKNTGEDTFSPTPSMTSFRVLNGYAAKHGRHIETGD